jgi:hypothetical protein
MCIIKHAGVELRTKVIYTYLFDKKKELKLADKMVILVLN